MARVLVLRPEPGASATVARARGCGLEAVAVPLFDVTPIAWDAPDPGSFDGLLLTSANAVRCGGEQLQRFRGLNTYAVGGATAETARDAGFDITATGDSGVDRLLGSIEPDLRLLHLCGADRREAGHPKQAIESVAVYQSREVEAPDLSGAEDCVALIHSPRAGHRFSELVRERTTISLAAISEAAAEAAGEGWKSVQVSEGPTDDALLALAARLCNKPEPK